MNRMTKVEIAGPSHRPLLTIWHGSDRLSGIDPEEARTILAQLSDALNMAIASIPRHLAWWEEQSNGATRWDRGKTGGRLAVWEAWPTGGRCPSVWHWTASPTGMGGTENTREEAVAAAESYVLGLGWALDPQPGDNR
jgi:hypothetical protein